MSFSPLRKTARTGREQEEMLFARNSRGEPKLSAQVKMWPTPRAGNPGSRPNGKGGKILAEEVKKSIAKIGENGGQLNPVWVEWLMGFPLEWTVLSVSETPSSLRSRKK
jgi:hypothetical protein